jgi:hypothetical protein
MSESNGERILKVGRQGRRKIQFGDDDPVFEIDVIEVYNQFSDLDLQFRDDKGEFDKARTADWNKACWGFVQQVVLDHLADLAAAEKINAAMSLTDARRFLKLLQEEANRLIPFFKVELDEKPSSPAPSPTVAYSE